MNATDAVSNQISEKPDLDLLHLQAELARIDVLIRREVHRWQLAGQPPDDSFRGLHLSDAEANRLLARPFATSWGQTVTLQTADAQTFERAETEAQRQIESVTAQANAQGRVTRWQYLAAEFELDQFELDTLLICLAPALDLRYERLYAYLQDDVTRKQPAVNLVLDLLCGPGPNRLPELSRFSQTSNLFKFNLVEPVVDKHSGGASLLNQTLNVDPAIVCWLLGTYRPHAKLGNRAELIQPAAKFTDDSFTQTQSQIENLLGDEPVTVFWGPDRLRQEEAAKSLVGQVGRALLRVNLAEVIAGGVSAPDALRLALRDARLVDAVPCLLGWDSCLQDGKPPSILLAELCAHPDTVIVIGKDEWRAEGVSRNRHLFWVEFPMPSFADRKILWDYYLGAAPAAEHLNLNDIAGQFTLTAGQIRDIVASARDRANQQNRPLQNEDIFAAARAHSSSGLARLARKIEPRYNWADIILPDDQVAILKELVSTVRVRPKVLEEWRVGQKLASGGGITVLFAGPPGTGKTMAAEVVAAELGLDLYKIDLSSVVSKYVGETEKNLEKIFDEAERSNAILFFDEADALFGKRSEVRDAHDRYANIEISYLLQRMDGYNGVTILATNLRANLDEAFTRRLQFAVDFPFPEQADVRLRIWESLFPPGVPRVPDLDLPLMAHRFKLAGGNIRNVIVSAAHLAAADGGQVTMDHMLHGLRREFQKMGRLVDEKELRLEK